MLLIIHPVRICRHASCNFMSKFSIAMCSGFPTRKSTRTECIEEQVQSTENSLRLQRVATLTPIISISVKKDLYSVERNSNKLKELEWIPVTMDYTKLHKHYLKLSKIRLTSLVVATTMAGYALAPTPFDIYTFVMCSLGTGLVSATANAINQFLEVPFDAQMSRTKNRVLVRNHLTSIQAVIFATVSGIVGLSILYSQVNGLTAALGAANVVLYTLIYTPLKRISILNTWVGSVVGAIPPLMGWAGCTGDILMPGALIMSGILYAWQFPHFNALSWNLRPDYSRAGYRMMAVTNPNLCRKTTLRYTAVLTGLCFLAPALDVTHWWFALASTPLNASFFYLAWKFSNHSDSANSRQLFRFSLLHLPLLMVLMLASKKYWANAKRQRDQVVSHNEPAKTNDLMAILTPIAPATSSV